MTTKPDAGAFRHYALLVTTVVLLLAGVAAFSLATVEGNTDHVGNHAVVDEEDSAEVGSAIARALVDVFTFDHGRPEVTRRAAARLLDGQAKEQYDLLFESLEERASGQQLTLRAEVQVTAVQELAEDRASVLVMLDQSTERASDGNLSVNAAQIRVGAERIGGDWLVTELELL